MQWQRFKLNMQWIYGIQYMTKIYCFIAKVASAQLNARGAEAPPSKILSLAS